MSDNGKNGNGRRPGRWQAYTLDTKLDRVRALFEHRHGCPPSEVVQSGPILLAGPIGENVLQRPHGAQSASNTATCKTGQSTGETPNDVLRATGGQARQLVLGFEEATA